jgi:hypothetical protein
VGGTDVRDCSAALASRVGGRSTVRGGLLSGGGRRRRVDPKPGAVSPAQVVCDLDMAAGGARVGSARTLPAARGRRHPGPVGVRSVSDARGSGVRPAGEVGEDATVGVFSVCPLHHRTDRARLPPVPRRAGGRGACLDLAAPGEAVPGGSPAPCRMRRPERRQSGAAIGVAGRAPGPRGVGVPPTDIPRRRSGGGCHRGWPTSLLSGGIHAGAPSALTDLRRRALHRSAPVRKVVGDRGVADRRRRASTGAARPTPGRAIRARCAASAHRFGAPACARNPSRGGPRRFGARGSSARACRQGVLAG